MVGYGKSSDMLWRLHIAFGLLVKQQPYIEDDIRPVRKIRLHSFCPYLRGRAEAEVRPYESSFDVEPGTIATASSLEI